MYRIEVAPGEETVFRTIEELAVGIRNGVITPRARIYHHASEKWLPIGLHPHYKKALDMPAASTASVPVTIATPIPTPSRLKAHPPAPRQPQSVVHYPELKRPPEPAPAPDPTPAPESWPPAKAADGPKIPAPMPSPVIAMQHEVLSDLPVFSIPEPLPWHTPAPQAPSPPVAVQAPATRTPAVHAPAPYAPASHRPASHRPPEFPSPAAELGGVETEEPRIPRATARRSQRMGGRPMLLLGVAAALVIGTHLLLTTTPSASADPPETPGSETGNDEPALDQAVPGTSSAETRAAEAPRVTVAPARVTMTPGPAFAGSVPARAGADSTTAPRPTRAPVPVPVSAPAAEGESIAPAPEAMELGLPDFPSDSVVPAKRTSDTLGMKKILRALNGAKPKEASAPQ
jgi:hypothetical protein